MEKINEIKIPAGVDHIAVKQYDDKIVIEFIPEKRRFKVGDKVRVKDSISNRTHKSIAINECIGKKLTVKEYSVSDFVVTKVDDYEYHFHEDWLEPYSDELKKGDLAIFWDDVDKGDDKSNAIIRLYDRKDDYKFHRDSHGIRWTNAIKFKSKEQFEKLLRGES